MQRLGKHLAIWGSVLQVGNVVGPAMTAVGMIRAFSLLGEAGDVDPDYLAASIMNAVLSTAVGLVVSLVGFVLIMIALFACKYRAGWLHSVMWLVAILWIYCAPPLGLALMVCLVVAGRRSFQPPESSSDEPAPGEPSGTAA